MLHPRKVGFLLTGLIVLVLAALRPAAAQTYTITDLGTLAGGSTYAYGINASGQVTGTSPGASGYAHAFVWTPTAPNGTTGAMRDLGLPGGFYYAQGRAINASGQVAGFGGNSGGRPQRALLWSGGAIVDLGTINGRGAAEAYAINALGEVAGGSTVSTFGTIDTFLWKPSTPNSTSGKMYDLNLPGGIGAAWGEPNIYGINTYGQIVWIDGFLWTPTTANGTTGAAVSLPGQPFGINDFGQVAGGDSGSSLWTPAAPNGTTGSLSFLTSGTAYAVNSSGQVVGVDGNNHPFLWKPTTPNNATSGTLTDLTTVTLYDPSGALASGWTLTNATGINDVGQIIGYGTHNGQTRAFLLTP